MLPRGDAWSVNPEQVPALERQAVPSAPLEWPTRALNFVLAVLAIVALLPVFVLVAVLVKLTSRGPVFYLQERVGLDRRLPGPEAHNHRRTRDLGGAPVHDLQVPHHAGRRRAPERRRLGPAAGPPGHPGRPGAAPVPAGRAAPAPQRAPGRDEHRRPPARAARPSSPSSASHITEYPLRQRAKPGITGLAQINHHYDRSLDDVRTKVSYDLEYIRRQSLREDLRIMLKTIPVILLRRGGW